MDNEERTQIWEFPMYDITSWGRVFNRESNRELRKSPVTGGTLAVSLYIMGEHYTRSVKVLVAENFVTNDWPEEFDTPTLVDGDEHNLHASNIRWRPRWFAIAYKKQINNPYDAYFSGPVVEESTGVSYKTVMDAAMATCSLPDDILKSILQNHRGDRVFPHRERYLVP